MVETTQLQTLVTVANCQSFSKAAEELKVTQSAISQSVKNLEEKIGVNLFKRSGKKVVLTTEGEKLYTIANDYLKKLFETLETIGEDAGRMSGIVRVGTLMGVGKSWLVPEMMSYCRDFENLKITVQLGFKEQLIAAFENYQLDLLVLPESDLPRVGERHFLTDETLTLVFPKDKRYDIYEGMSLQELSSLPTILFEENDPLYYRWCHQHYQQVPKKINTRFVVNAHGSMLHAVSTGLGVAVIPKHVLERSYYRFEVQSLGEKWEVSNGKIYLVNHKESERLLRVKTTIDRLINDYKSVIL
jgi:DNA-binding transcriptional LysR family regulator